MGSVENRSHFKLGDREVRTGFRQRAAMRETGSLRKLHTPPGTPFRARQFVAQHGHWVLVGLLAILVERVYSPESAPKRTHVAIISPGSSANRPLGAATEPAPIAEHAASPAAADGRDPDGSAKPRDEAGEDHRQVIARAPEAISLVLEPSENGAYYLHGTINEQEVMFLVDTGASVIAVPDRLRHRLKLGRGRYVEVSTASGRVGNYETVVDRLALGPLNFRNVAGVLNPHAPNDLILLGMSAVKDLRIVQSERRLTLTQMQRSPSVEDTTAAVPTGNETLAPRRALRECSEPGQVIDRWTLACMEGR